MDFSTPSNHGTIGLRGPSTREEARHTRRDQPGRRRLRATGAAFAGSSGASPSRPSRPRSTAAGSRPSGSSGRRVAVEADVFADGHDALAAVVKYSSAPPPVGEANRMAGRVDGPRDWTEVPMAPLVNDRWRGEFPVSELGRYVYTIEAWVDEFETWSRQLAKRIAAGQDVDLELEVGARMVEAAAARARGSRADASSLTALAQAIRVGGVAAIKALPAGSAAASCAGTPSAATRRPMRASSRSSSSARRRGSAPGTSCSRVPTGAARANTAPSATSRAACRRSPRMGFDVLYLPPIHPIGRTHRKGANNSLRAAGRARQPVGDRLGGGRPQVREPALGTLDDFRHLVGPPPARESTSRSTSRSSARPTTRTCASTPSGSSTGPTARSSTRRTRPRSTRTSTRSTSSASTGASCGRSSCRSSSSGSSRAFASSASTTRTPSRSRSGSG